MNDNTIAVVGAGTMGAGIAQLAALHGSTVHLLDIDADALSRCVEGIRKRFARSVEKGRLSTGERDEAIARIQPASSIVDLGDVDLAVEAVIEDLDVKRKVFRAFDEATPPGAVLATNTSSLSITRIAEAVQDASRVVGMHFFNPAAIMPLVEVVAGKESSESSIATAVRIARSWGKVPVRAKDTPGFIVNRVARGFYLEALRLLGEGVAGVDEIDNVLRVQGRFKMGPFELMDLIGVDVNLAVTLSVWEQFNKRARFAPHDIQRQLVAQNHLGRKTGRGFYQHDADRVCPAVCVERRSFELSPLLSDTLRAFSTKAGLRSAGTTEQYIFGRILGAIINEAGWACCDAIATSDDIDIAMVKGTNYPKGPLAWANEIGHRTVRGLLKALNDTVADGRYGPAPLFASAD